MCISAITCNNNTVQIHSSKTNRLLTNTNVKNLLLQNNLAQRRDNTKWTVTVQTQCVSVSFSPLQKDHFLLRVHKVPSVSLIYYCLASAIVWLMTHSKIDQATRNICSVCSCVYFKESPSWLLLESWRVWMDVNLQSMRVSYATAAAKEIYIWFQ